MALTSSGNPIKISDVQAELGSAYGGSMSVLFGESAMSTGPTQGLMYHNIPSPTNSSATYGMGLNATLTAKQAIYDTWLSSQNLKLSNWWNYRQDIEIVYSLEIDNQSPSYYVDFNFYIRDQNGNNTYLAHSGTVSKNTKISYLDYAATGFYTSTTTGGYDFKIEGLTTDAPLGASVNMLTPTVSDTDNVGAGVGRTGYTPVTNPFDSFSVQDFVVCDDSGGLIDITKRTTVILVFQ